MSVAREAGVPVPPFYLSDNARLFVMRRFDRDADLNPLGFEDMTALMGLSAEQKYSKSYSAIAKAIRLFFPPEHVQSSLAQLFSIVALSCIVGNGDAHLKNFGLLYSNRNAARRTPRAGLRYRQHHGVHPRGCPGIGLDRQPIAVCFPAGAVGVRQGLRCRPPQGHNKAATGCARAGPGAACRSMSTGAGGCRCD